METEVKREFLATRTEPDGDYGESIFADSEEAAKLICEENGWTYDGELYIVFSAEDTSAEEMDALIAHLNGDTKPN